MDWQAHVRHHLALPPGPDTDSLVEELAQHLHDLFEEALRDGHTQADAIAIAHAALASERRRSSRALVRSRGSTVRALGAWSRSQEPLSPNDKRSWPASLETSSGGTCRMPAVCSRGRLA